MVIFGFGNLLTRKYAPKKLDDVIGNDDIKEKVRTWILNWLRGKQQKAILLYGAPGIGKTSIAYALANEFNMHIIELGASDLRDKNRIRRIIKSAFMGRSLDGHKKLILIDDIDAITSRDRGGISELSRLLSAPKCPVILTANDAWDSKLSSLRNKVMVFNMKKVSPHKIFLLLKKICKKEGIELDESYLLDLAKNADGDVRSALNDLQALLPGNRDRKSNIFEILKLIFKSMKFNASRVALAKTDVDYNTLELWIEENIPLEYTNIDDLRQAYDYISRADIFLGRISNRQYWGFLKYALLLMTAGVGLAKKDVYRKFTKYKFPQVLSKLSYTKQNRAMLHNIAKKIGKRLHVSSKTIIKDFWLYADLILKDTLKASMHYRLNDEELSFLRDLSEKKYKVW